jgi:tetratricopeptide (TPR) repeat protein
LEKLIATYPESSILGESWFNLGKLHVKNGQGAAAVKDFERCIDHTSGTPLAPIADLYLGRLLLEADEPRRAVLALRRAASLATSSLRAHATVSLAAAHLRAGHPEHANQVLRSARNELEGPATRNAAAFLSALSQVRAAGDSYRRKYNQETLVDALSRVSPDDFFGWQGAELIAAAYGDLGLTREAAEVCRHAVERMPDCPLRSRLRLTLADDAIDRGDFTGAEEILRGLLSGTEPSQEGLVRKRLCELLLKRERIDDSQAEALIWLEAAETPSEQAEALRALGRCLERKGDRLNAALCFAGSRPTIPSLSALPDTVPAEVGSHESSGRLSKQ